MDTKLTTLGDYFYRIQIEVPRDGDLEKLLIQICHKLGVYFVDETGKPDYSQALGEAPGEGILTMPNITELEEEYPGAIEAMAFLQRIAIIEGKKQVALMQEARRSNGEQPV